MSHSPAYGPEVVVVTSDIPMMVLQSAIAASEGAEGAAGAAAISAEEAAIAAGASAISAAEAAESAELAAQQTILLQDAPGAVAQTTQEVYRETINVKQFGAKGNYVSASNKGADDTAAIMAAIAYATTLGPACIIFPRGKYRITSELNIFRPAAGRADLILQGEDQLSTILVCDFFGAGRALLDAVDPAGGSARVAPVSFIDLGFVHVSAAVSGGVNPRFIRVRGIGESRIRGIRFGGSNSTHIELISAQNLRVNDLVSFYGGRHFNYKDTTGIKFTVTTSDKTITADKPIFSAGDVGKLFSVFPPDVDDRIRYTIATYIDPTHVTYSDARGRNETGSSGRFEPARCSIALGSNVLVANAEVFRADMVGMTLAVRAARSGPYGIAILRATITGFTSGTTVTLDRVATVEAVDQFFAVPTVDLGTETGYAGSSDVTISEMQIEHYDGLGLLCMNTDSYQITASKIHGETKPSDLTGSMAAIWLDDHGGRFEIEIDSTSSMSDCRVYACNLNDYASLTDTNTRGIVNGVVFKTEFMSSPDGYLIIQGMNSYIDFNSPLDMIDDANFAQNPRDPRILLCGPVNMVGDNQKARIYSGRGAYFTPSGRIVMGDSSQADNFMIAMRDEVGCRIQMEDTGLRAWSFGNTPGGGSNFVFRDDSGGFDVLRLRPGQPGEIPASVITSPINWGGTAPSGTSWLYYRWARVGPVVTFRMRLEYSVAGALNTGVAVDLPPDMPLPERVPGSGSGEFDMPLMGALASGVSASGQPALTKAYLINAGNDRWVATAQLNTGSISAIFAMIAGSYLTE